MHVSDLRLENPFLRRPDSTDDIEHACNLGFQEYAEQHPLLVLNGWSFATDIPASETIHALHLTLLGDQ